MELNPLLPPRQAEIEVEQQLYAIQQKIQRVRFTGCLPTGGLRWCC